LERLAIVFMASLQGSSCEQIIDLTNQDETGEKDSMLDPQPSRIPFASPSASFSVWFKLSFTRNKLSQLKIDTLSIGVALTKNHSKSVQEQLILEHS
jgi:hypothetical protein